MRSPVTGADTLVLEAPRHLVRRSLPVPDIGPDDALLRVEACGLCGTDHEQFTGVLPSGFAFVPGHETVGTIEVIGSRAAGRWGVDVGSRVAVEVFQSCRVCGPCSEGDYRRCAVHGVGDMYGFISVDKSPRLWGGYAQYQYLSPDTLLHRVPSGLDPVLATLFNPLGAGVRWGVTLPGTGPGDVVAVMGPGIRGLSAVAATKEAGAELVLVTGNGRRDAERLALAKRFGADVVVDVERQDPVEVLRKRTGGGLADVVVDVTAKAPAALAQSLALARPGGTVVVAGTRGSAQTPGFWPDLIVYKELRILGALGVDAEAYRIALGLLDTGRYPFAQLPRRRVGLDDVATLLSAMAGENGDAPVHGVVEPWA
ncbi:MAG TPA: zinc-binding dehydrogenase [Acidimicrobiales bacterium]|nr:zinc-binding dehydrogenase [Acidimicrobiales bacterium]